MRKVNRTAGTDFPPDSIKRYLFNLHFISNLKFRPAAECGKSCRSHFKSKQFAYSVNLIIMWGKDLCWKISVAALTPGSITRANVVLRK